MGERAEDPAPKRFLQASVGARRVLPGVSATGFSVAMVPLLGESMPVLGIDLTLSKDVFNRMLTLVVLFLTASFMVGEFSYPAAARRSRVEIRHRERIKGQTDDIRNRTVERLGDLFHSGPAEMFHARSVESLLINAVRKAAARLGDSLRKLEGYRMTGERAGPRPGVVVNCPSNACPSAVDASRWDVASC